MFFFLLHDIDRVQAAQGPVQGSHHLQPSVQERGVDEQVLGEGGHQGQAKPEEVGAGGQRVQGQRSQRSHFVPRSCRGVEKLQYGCDERLEEHPRGHQGQPSQVLGGRSTCLICK